jgi:hypothetical protein
MFHPHLGFMLGPPQATVSKTFHTSQYLEKT